MSFPTLKRYMVYPESNVVSAIVLIELPYGGKVQEVEVELMGVTGFTPNEVASAVGTTLGADVSVHVPAAVAPSPEVSGPESTVTVVPPTA